MKKKFWLGLASVALLAACGNGAETDSSNGGAGEGAVIGGNFELSGGASAYGTPMDQGVKLAVENINEAGGVLGEDVSYKSYDNKSEPQEAASVATRLATEDNVSAIIGPATTGDANAQTPAVTRAGVPAILPAATGDDVTMDGETVWEYIFRVCFQDSFQGEVLANFAQNNLEATKAVIIVDNSTDYGVGLAEAFKDVFTGDIVKEENFTTGQTDFQAILTNIRNEDFDVIFIPGYYEEAGLVIKQAREMGIEQPILGPDGFANSILVELAGEQNVNNVYYTGHFTPNSEEPKVQEFLAQYEEKYGTAADSFAALAYDAANLLFEAMEVAGSTDPQAVTDALPTITGFEGITGTFSLDENHNPIKNTFVIELQGGVEVANTIVEP
ncbi:ABC transporter substrate-binding protein [Jeotgalibaca ciconiae]|uniref:ABC transporter substrate-binding protein n=1 Tax=Jeotgalibaca ciconiae TaxID=2496265 RepID=A0A3Q9BKM6_9LACT|nr:ABC transporter substrate-binding protein [Jeotgalibaca ciconiae]AZP04629.1 ABC transporter substrate-binding protein [Jeotgalibaca ciconiae]HJB23127.1 ABC transporter substrate-binding protein [Candidatus Jeotgalibaca pullicola]